MPALAPPLARLPLHHWHAAHGAQFAERSGWQVVLRYTGAESEAQAARAGLGVADVSASAKVSLHGPGVSALAQSLVPDGSASMPHGVGVTTGDHSALACRLAEDHLLLIAFTANGKEPWPPSSAGVISSDVTSAYAGFVVAGPRTEALLCRLMALDVRPAAFPVPSCVETSLAGVEALLVRTAESDLPTVRVYLAWDVAEYVWDRLMDAGREWAVTPHGIETLGLLAERTGSARNA